MTRKKPHRRNRKPSRCRKWKWGEAVKNRWNSRRPIRRLRRRRRRPDADATAAQRAQMALLGGPLGGGFNAPPVNSPVVGYDFTEPFRRVVSACAPGVPSVDPRERISVRIRVFLNRDGTLTRAPLMRESNPSAKQEAMMQSFAAGLAKCQPYTMLPPRINPMCGKRSTSWSIRSIPSAGEGDFSLPS